MKESQKKAAGVSLKTENEEGAGKTRQIRGSEGLQKRSHFTILDISDYEPPRAPSRTWRELIKKVWEVDPLTCPQCGSEMRIISLIQDPDVISRILERLGLWRQDTGPRCKKPKPGYRPVVHEDFDGLSACNTQAGGWPGYEEPTITFH